MMEVSIHAVTLGMCHVHLAIFFIYHLVNALNRMQRDDTFDVQHGGGDRVNTTTPVLFVPPDVTNPDEYRRWHAECLMNEDLPRFPDKDAV